MVVEGEFQSQPFLTINYTNGDKLEGLGCCELSESVSTHSIWVQKVSMGQAKFVPTHNPKMVCGDYLGDHIPISTLCNHSLYL